MRRLSNNLNATVFPGVAFLTLWAGHGFAAAAEVVWSVASIRLLAGAITLALATLYVLSHQLGFRPAMRFMAAALVISWLAEALGLRNAWLFGSVYSYHPALRPVLPGGVPLFIPLSWFVVIGMPVMLLRSWKTGGNWARLLWKSAVGALGAVACDLALDPIAVSVGLWSWQDPGPYFGVPAMNFAGWWLVAFVMLLAGYAGCARKPAESLWVPIRFDLGWSGANGLLLALLTGAAYQHLDSGLPVLWAFLALSPLLAFWHVEVFGKIKACRPIPASI